MRGRIVLFVVLAVVTALVGGYVGWSTNTPKAVGEPATATPADSSVGPTQRRGSGSGPARSPTASPPKATPPKATPPASPPRPNTGPVRFGKVAATPLDTALTSIAPDGSALTTTFDDLGVEVGQGVTESDVTQSFSMTLPLSDGAKGKTLRVQAQGYAIALGGTSARLTLKLNGQVRVRNFPAGSNTEFVQTLEVPAIPASTAQLSGVIEVQEDPGTGAVANLSVVSIDSEIS